MEAKIVNQTEKSIVIEIEIPFGESMLESEELIQEQLNKAGCVATSEALSRFDTDGEPIVVDGVPMTTKGQIPKTYQTPYGEVEIARHFYQGPRGGRGYCPLENDARIITTATPKFAKIVSSKYTDSGGARVQKDLSENHCRDVSKSHIQNICNVVGNIAAAKEADWSYDIPIPVIEQGVKTITIGVDGTCMLMCGDGYRQAMTGTIALYDDDKNKLHTIYIAAKPEYGKQEFFDRMENEIEQVKVMFPDAKYVGLADGAKDNWTFLERFTDLQLIDFYHASEYVGNAGNAAVDKKERKEWIENACHELKNEPGAAGSILSEMKGFLKNDLSEDNEAKVTAAVTYFENNIHRMDYASNVAENLPIGSGVTEAACKVIVKDRLCKSGMKWKEKGASVVLTLRCLSYSSGRWEQFWNKIDSYGITLSDSLM